MKQLILDKNLISDIKICPKEIVTPWNRGLLVVAFNYYSPYTFEILKVSKNKTTTHFRCMEGQDYHFDFFPLDMELIRFQNVPFVYPGINYQ